MTGLPALLGGVPIRSRPYLPYNTIGDEEKRRVMAVLDTGLLSGFVARGNNAFLGGPAVQELEACFRDRFKCDWAVSFNSATSALHGCLIALGVGPGDEVIVPPYTMSATVAAVVMCRAVPVFVDIEPEMFCIDAEKIAAVITSRTKAIMAVNLFGQSADILPILTLAKRHGLSVIEDNAQAPGALYRGQLTGTVAHMGVFSLNRHKTIQCGEGGVAVTNDQKLAENLRLVRNHGEMVLSDWKREEPAELVGYNYRLTELSAAVAIPQLAKLDELNAGRIQLAGQLTEILAAFPFIQPARVREGCSHVYYLYPMLYQEEELGLTRDTVLAALQAEGIHAAEYVLPLYWLPLFARHQHRDDPGFSKVFPLYDRDCHYQRGLCPVVERVQTRHIIVTNICRQPHTGEEIDEFGRALARIRDHAEALRTWQDERS
ncbi:MAG: DegT/DnrJ/EryC1/StrS family aminotransferase [Magnetococcales bacterium]|nr:DegT/DnrJ/EryC1/StrS family aminotransferase [Magnetococcales bacterium]MBF0148973.1 DegT/DnrJ/EryC1/StrS family aminotransferase [Magnetococcales bacterium]MBF0603039.1 DegT/DnrJ/EryC1/StrS family aminotransferase [Magnetococcales bacterium]